METYKGLLLFFDGREKIIDIPGDITTDGRILVPETITVDTHLFELDTSALIEECFEYKEVSKFRKKPHIPYQSHLH